MATNAEDVASKVQSLPMEIQDKVFKSAIPLGRLVTALKDETELQLTKEDVRDIKFCFSMFGIDITNDSLLKEGIFKDKSILDDETLDA